MKYLNHPPEYLFFSGKGGVGKTSLACATAVTLADSGKKVLLVSTDPASNLGHVFDCEIKTGSPEDVPGISNLKALNIDPSAAAAAYRERLIGPVQGALPEGVIKRMEEELSGACTTEIAAFDEFTEILTDPGVASEYDHIIFDTAPTGHTLRLLKLPAAWTDFLDSNENGASCLGPLAGLEKQRDRYRVAVEKLCDPNCTQLLLVSRPQISPLKEVARTCEELKTLGIKEPRLLINGILPESGHSDDLMKAIRDREMAAMNDLPEVLKNMETDLVDLSPTNILGANGLRNLLLPNESRTDFSAADYNKPDAPGLSDLVDSIEADKNGLVMFMGKGGVGKTTTAAAVAIELARRGHDVHLSTTDPAAHLEAEIREAVRGLIVSRIDPEIEIKRYQNNIMKTQGRDLDEKGKALLAEDLRSPCTEEIAVFQAFSKVIAESRNKFVILDTAPTGHTLLLLDATGSYHKEVQRHSDQGELSTPLMILQNPELTKVVIITLPETTPVLEAENLQKELRRAGVEPWAWVVNSSLAPLAPANPFLKYRAASELSQIDRVRNELSNRFALIPWNTSQSVSGEKDSLASV